MAAGRIFQINVSEGGVPKLAVQQAEITAAGVAGDRQKNLKLHGGPQRAVCLYALERILALQEEGHPVFPGALGENLTVAGMDWGAIAPGAVLRVGADVVLDVVSYTEPCGSIKRYFADGDPQRIAQERHAGWSRVYARVLTQGRVAAGDPMIVEA